ncbi:alpha/beta hydrolase [Croceivirga sp. JEA036]|nr:alpha/beta hydrolase [Croceivirga sp. JEA036]
MKSQNQSRHSLQIFVLGAAFILNVCTTLAQNQMPKVVGGTLERLENFKSEYVTARNVDIWLPKGYSNKNKYAVLYMHDGQMLYDADMAWNKQTWNVDDIASELLKENKVKPFIVVGIHNGGATRHPDYFPQKPYQSLSIAEKDTVTAQLKASTHVKSGDFTPNSDNYLKFLVKELKPYIDQKFSVKTNRKNTFIAGSSMGGLISMYAISEYPKVFGGAICMSTHWVGTFNLDNNPMPRAFLSYLKENLPNPRKHKIYFDCGDKTLDALYPEIQAKVDVVMKEHGYKSKNWQTRYFPGENHSEDAWQKRFSIPLKFMLGTNEKN